jgi:uncharacterized protein YndB with AHSA1/START domain
MSKHSLEVTTPNPTDIVMTRAFDAPWQMVYDAMTRPELIKRWWGAKRGELVACEYDLRVGGKWRHVFRANGQDMVFAGEFRELNAPTRMVHTERFMDSPDSIITTTFVEKAGKTTMTAVIHYPSQEIRDAVIATGMTTGAGESYDALNDMLTEAR